MPLPVTRSLLGDGIQFRDFLLEHFPDLVNTCVGRAELSKRYRQHRVLTQRLSCPELNYLSLLAGKTGPVKCASASTPYMEL
jgi:hypothetical protein